MIDPSLLIGNSDAEEATPRPVRESCLLIMPTSLFFYPGELCRALERMGYRVTLANDEYPQNPIGKAIGKLDWKLSRWLTRRTIRRRFIEGRRWDLVLIIKGRGVGPELIHDIRKHARRVVGYHYDALDYDRSTRRWGNLVDRISTFDPRDAKQEGWDLVGLFAACEVPPEAVAKRYPFSAVLRNHSNRLAYVDRIIAAVPGCRCFIYFYEKDLLTMLANFVRNPRAYWRWRRHIHFAPLPYDQFVTVLSESEFTIDYGHPRQAGSTMRSVEARALGIKLITNDKNLRCSRTTGENHVIYCGDEFSPHELSTEVERLKGSYPQAVSRSPENFLMEVLGISRPSSLPGRKTK